MARSVVVINGSQREAAEAFLACIPSGSILVFDRGCSSYEFINNLRENYERYFLFRCPSKSNFKAVEDFVRTGQEEGFILIDSSNNHIKKKRLGKNKKGKPIQLRIVRLVSPDGTVSVLLTNMLNNNPIPGKKIMDLYFRRWAVEDYYRTEKVFLDIETFHSKTPNGIREELFAISVMSVIAGSLMLVP